MAPRSPSPGFDSRSGSPSDFEVLKPKTENAKVTKTKAPAKPKAAAKPKVEKVVKPKKEPAVKKEPGVKKAAKEAPVDIGDGVAKAKGVVKKEAGVKKESGGGDGKVKEKPVTGEEAEKLIVEYLRVQNRPYSATEVSANLHGKVTKTNTDKILKDISEKEDGPLAFKATNGTNKGSQFVFWIKQDAGDAASPEELAAMDDAVREVKEGLVGLKGRVRDTGARLAAARKGKTKGELVDAVESLRGEMRGKLGKLRGFKEGAVKQVTKEEVDKIDKDFKFWSTKRKVRKNAFDSIQYFVQDQTSMTKDELWEKVGVEEDDYSLI